MKIVCESCGAKYSIADDRITGKAFKIRCKRCSEVIVVRADQQPQAAAPQAEAQEGIWHIVIDGEQSGPFSPSQLADMLNAGTVDWEAYVWTEGFDNWLPMRDVEDLVAQITGDAAPQQPQAQPAHKTSTLVGQPSMGADPFADDGGASDGGMFGSDSPSGAGPDLFGSNAGKAGGSPFASPMDREGVVASSPMPRTAPDASLTGARNENSVLFSLKNLQALATGSSTPSMPPGASGRSPGFATGEGSGLIDIRALATATGIGDGGAAKGSKDDLLSLGTQGGAFGALGSPMLAPGAGQDEGGNRTLIWASVAGVAFLSIAAVAVAYIMRAPAAQAPAVGLVAAAPVAAAPVAQAPTAEPQAAAPTEGELAAKAAAAQAATASTDAPRSSGSSRSHRGGGSNSDKNAPAERAAEGPAPEERKAPEKPGGPRSIDSLLDNALNGPAKGSRAAPAAAPSSNLPDTPSKPDVMAAMSSVKPQVVACGNGQGGVATVTISVAGTTGRVTNAQVAGATGSIGSCVAQAVRKAQFPKFQQKVFKLVFPFKL